MFDTQQAMREIADIQRKIDNRELVEFHGRLCTVAEIATPEHTDGGLRIVSGEVA